MANEQHHADEVEDPHEDAGHVEKLRKRPMRMDDGWIVAQVKETTATTRAQRGRNKKRREKLT